MFRSTAVNSQPTRNPKFAFVSAGQVRTDGLPTVSFILCAEDMVPASIDDSTIMRRKGNREGPGKAVFQVFWSPTEPFFRPDVYQSQLFCFMVIVLQCPFSARRTSDRADVNNVRIIWFYRNESTFTSSGESAFLKRNCTVGASTWDADARVVLLSGINTIGKLIVNVDTVKLSCDLVINCRPCFSTVVRNTSSSVVALNHA